MRYVILVVLCAVCCTNVFAQTEATTKEGKTVILNDNGTWTYKDSKPDTGSTPLEVSHKPSNATTLLKGIKVNYGIWYDKKKWVIDKKASNETIEYRFELIGKDAYVMIIPEQVEIQEDSLVNIAYDNAQKASASTKLLYKGSKIVNGVNVRVMQLEGNIRGIDFIYDGYYYSGERGSIQLVGYTGERMFKEYKKDIEELLNGFVILPDSK